MKIWFALFPLIVLATGCTTTTVESRKQERLDAYSSLTPEQKNSVDSGQIKVGMPMDAVFIAWGKPSQILDAETSSGPQVRWLYAGSYMQSVTYWSYPGYGWSYHRVYGGPELIHDFAVRDYIRAEVVFEGGIVKEWRALPQPGR
jgi:hypothetical protein